MVRIGSLLSLTGIGGYQQPHHRNRCIFTGNIFLTTIGNSSTGYVFSKLPAPDTRVEFKHPYFDSLLDEVRADIAPQYKLDPKDLGISFRVEAHTRNSDIEWNDMAGKIWAHVFNKNTGAAIYNLFNAQLVNFTGNCGAKAISHVNMYRRKGDDFTKKCFEVFESFARWRTNCGWLLGSDTCVNNPPYSYEGRTLPIIRLVGGFNITEPTWNPNYSSGRHHGTVLFWKDLIKQEYPNYWTGERTEFKK
jgi:hypothetical protein